ncbi:winged helix-turn-helix transcriptional regulator [Rhodococcus sp. IEGM1428]|uniref:winged helix-turn-helix transcriptional regulator n=1 Tax=Rhodococcus sp. IEGM1428 TaxID=3392191 RepID=UPI003D0FE32E
MSEPSDGTHRLVVDCQLRAATDLLHHRWDVVVVAALGDEALRRVHVKKSVGPIRDKSLNDALARLCSNGLVKHKPHRSIPGVFVYELTELGRGLHDGPLRALGMWAQEHGEELLAASNDSCAL